MIETPEANAMEVTGTVTVLEAELVAVETGTEIQAASEAVSQTGLTGDPNREKTPKTETNARRIRHKNQRTVFFNYNNSVHLTFSLRYSICY